jgi:hypothetical protein
MTNNRMHHILQNITSPDGCMHGFFRQFQEVKLREGCSVADILNRTDEFNAGAPYAYWVGDGVFVYNCVPGRSGVVQHEVALHAGYLGLLR